MGPYLTLYLVCQETTKTLLEQPTYLAMGYQPLDCIPLKTEYNNGHKFVNGMLVWNEK